MSCTVYACVVTASVQSKPRSLQPALHLSETATNLFPQPSGDVSWKVG